MRARGAARQFQPARDFRGDVLEADAEAGRLLDGAFLARRDPPSASRSSSPIVTLTAVLLPSRMTLTGTVEPGLVRVTMSTSWSRFFTALPLNSTITSRALMPALAAGPPAVTADTKAPERRGQAEILERLGTHRRDRDADHAARDLAGAQLRHQFAHEIDRHGETDAHVGRLGAVAEDGGVDADDLAAHVEQRSAGVARVDGRVGLEHVDAALRRDRKRPAQRADDADGDGVVEVERVADRHHEVARLHLIGVAELDLLQRRRRLLQQLDEGAVGQRVAADDLGFELDVALVAEEGHFDLVGVLDDVVVGQDQALGGIDDEPGAGALRLRRRALPAVRARALTLALCPGPALALIGEEPAQEVLTAEELGELLGPGRGLGADVHDRRRHLARDGPERRRVDARRKWARCWLAALR